MHKDSIDRNDEAPAPRDFVPPDGGEARNHQRTYDD